MKVALVLFACVSVALARPNHIPGHVDPPKEEESIPAVQKEIQVPKIEVVEPAPVSRPTRDLSHSYQTPEGIVRSESVDPNSNTITGRVSWVAPDGRQYSVTYQGDTGGYHAQGVHIPR